MATASIEHGFELRGETTSLRTLLRDIWRHRHLVRTLARKDFFVRYRRASFGVLWAVGLPLVQAVVLAIVFTKLLPGGPRLTITRGSNLPFAVYVFSGILPWSFFSGAVLMGVGTIVDGSNLATRIYFPRALLPIVAVTSGLYAFVPSVVILLGLALGFGVDLGPHLLLLVPALIVMYLLSIAFALMLSGMQVYFRDVKHIVAAVTLPWFWASGVFFPIENLGDLRRWVEINPAVGMIQLFRAALDGAAPHYHTAVWWTLAWIVVLGAIGLLIHRRYDRVFVDLL